MVRADDPPKQFCPECGFDRQTSKFDPKFRKATEPRRARVSSVDVPVVVTRPKMKARATTSEDSLNPFEPPAEPAAEAEKRPRRRRRRRVKPSRGDRASPYLVVGAVLEIVLWIAGGAGSISILTMTAAFVVVALVLAFHYFATANRS